MATGTIKDTNYANIVAKNGGQLILNVDITTYNSSENAYIAPRDGYIVAQAGSAKGIMSLYDAYISLDIAPSYLGDVFVKKGCKVWCSSNISRAFFRAFW